MDKIGKISIAAAEDENTMRRMQQSEPTIPADIKNQPTIPAGISRDMLNTVKKAAATNYLETMVLGTKKENSHLTSGTTDIMRAHSRSINAGQLLAGRRIDGIREKQRDIARQLAGMQGRDPAQAEDVDRKRAETAPTARLDKVKARLSELERISIDINQNISHIAAVVAIKDNYLHQLRTAEKLLAKYEEAQQAAKERVDDDTDNSVSDEMDQAEIFHAAYTVIMHNVPRRYNPEASNKDGHETIAQVISRLEKEVSDLNSKAAEESFEVGLEMALLNEIQSDSNIDAETLNNKANQAVGRYVKTMRDAGVKAIDVQRELDIKKEALIRIRKNIFPLEANPVADSGMIKSGMPYEYRFSNLERLSENANGGVFEESGAPSKVRVDEVDKLTKSGYVEVPNIEKTKLEPMPTGKTGRRAIKDFEGLGNLLTGDDSKNAPGDDIGKPSNRGVSRSRNPNPPPSEWDIDNF